VLDDLLVEGLNLNPDGIVVGGIIKPTSDLRVALQIVGSARKNNGDWPSTLAECPDFSDERLADIQCILRMSPSPSQGVQLI
jgi:hypothetical protein